LRDKLTQWEEQVIKPGGYPHLSLHPKLGVGYKNQAKNHAPNEHDA
jgi:hypothetical protein